MSKKKDGQQPEKLLENAKSAAEDTAKETAEAVSEAAEKAESTARQKEKKQPKKRTPQEEADRALNRVKRRKKLKYGALATTITLVFIAIVVVANVICNVLDNRYDWNIDLTSTGLYQIDDQTVQYLNRLNTDIDMVVLADETYFDNYSQLKVVKETLNRFKAESNGHISLKYVDITAHPEAVSAYSQNYSGEFEEADVVVASGDLVRVLSFDDLISVEQSVDYTTYQQVTNYSFIGEQSLLSAIMGVTDLNPVSVAVINFTNSAQIYYQYDGANFDKLLDLLEKNNYNVIQTDIALNDIPEDCEIAILCAPYNDLSEAQIQKLTDFLYNGGQYGRQLVYFASPFQQSTPNLDAFLEVWGIEIGRSLIYEGNSSAAQYVQLAYLGMQSNIPVVSATDSELNAAVVSSKLPLIAPISRPVKQLFTSNSGRTTESLLTTADTAYLYTPENAQADDTDDSTAPAETTAPADDTAPTETTDTVQAAETTAPAETTDAAPETTAAAQTPASAEETGSYNVAVYATQSFIVDNEEQTSGIVAFGSAWFLDYYVASSSSYDNANYFVSLLNTMTGKENVLVIAEKSLDSTSITITEAQAKAIRNVTVFCIPLIVAIIGIAVYLRRRNK